MDYPAHTHLTKVKVAVLAVQSLFAAPDFDVWVQVKVVNSAFASTDEQFDSIALPASLFILVLRHLFSAATAHLSAWGIATDYIR